MTNSVPAPKFFLSMSIAPDKFCILEKVAGKHGLKVAMAEETNKDDVVQTKATISVYVIGDRDGKPGENWELITQFQDASRATEKASASPEKEK